METAWPLALYQPLLCKADMLGASHNDVVEHPNIDHPQDLLEPLRDLAIGIALGRILTWMVMA